MGIPVPPSGSTSARIMIVGEAPGAEEERQLAPFVGASGMELNRMLAEAGITRSECFLTNLCKERPPKNEISLWFRKSTKFSSKPSKEDEKKRAAGVEPKDFVPLRSMLVHPKIKEGFRILISEIETVKPNMVIPLGNSSMWALTGKWGIVKWRGSMLEIDTEELSKWL